MAAAQDQKGFALLFDALRYLSPLLLGGVGLYVSLVVTPLQDELKAAKDRIAKLETANELYRDELSLLKAYKLYVVEPHIKEHR